VIDLQDVSKTHRTAAGGVEALCRVNLSLEAGELVVPTKYSIRA